MIEPMKKFKKFRQFALLAFAFLLTLGLSSCKKDGGAEAFGEMEISMTDSPGDFQSLVVEITQVEAYSSATGWVVLNSATQSHDILTLTNGTEVVIASNAELEPENYTKIRLTYGSNSYVVVDALGASATFSLTADSQTEIDIETEYDANGKASITLDFHAGQSVFGNATTGFDFRPVVTEMKNKATGVRGRMEAGVQAYVEVSGEGRTYDCFSDADGNFMVRGMVAGTYTMDIYPEDSQANGEMHRVENVVVVDGEIRQMGTIEF